MYSGSINVSFGMTIVKITQPNNTFLNGNSYLANPYPAMEQIRIWISVSEITYANVVASVLGYVILVKEVM